MELYAEGAEGLTLLHRVGSVTPISQRPYPAGEIIFPLPQTEAGTQTYILKAKSQQLMEVSLAHLDLAELGEYRAQEKLYLGLATGVFGVMFFYNLFIYLILKKRAYFYYLAYLLLVYLFYFVHFGYARYYLWPEVTEWVLWSINIPLLFALMAATQYTRYCLLTAQYLPQWDRRLKTLSRVAPFFLLTIATGVPALFEISTELLVLASLILFFFIGLQSWKQGYQPALYYVLGWSVLGLFGSLRILSALGWYPLTPFIERAFVYGSFFEMVFFSLALASQIQQHRKIALEGEQKIAQMHQEQATKLEQRVKEATQELMAANHEKTRFLSLISHDLKDPVGTLAVLLRTLQTSPEEAKPKLLKQAAQMAERVHQLLLNLLTWAKSQSGSLKPQPEQHPLIPLLAEVLTLMGQEAKQKQVRLKPNIPLEASVYADAPMLITLVRNLLANALKYSSAGQVIFFNALHKGNQIRLEVKDQGIGMDERTLANLFRLGEQHRSPTSPEGEMGSGLGLLLVKEFAEKNQGRVGVTSKLGQGSCFWVELPATPPQRET